MIAEFIRRACQEYPQTRILVVTHVTELVTQNAQHLVGQWPEANISFYAQKLGKKSMAGHIIFATINSIYKKAYKLPHAIDIVIIDECHLVSPNSLTMYRKFLDDLKTINPHLKVIGFTGTNFRATEGRLTEGEGRLFTDVAYQIPMLYLIEKGFLCPLVTPKVETHMSTEGVKTRNGDYIESQLQNAVDKDYITKSCVNEILHHGQDRKKWLIFTAGVEHCGHVLEEIKSRGVSAEMVVGDTPTEQRNSIISRFKNGDLRCVVNVAVMTTGFNNPAIDLMAFMRPTRSPVLAVQMSGRGMRTNKDKQDCLLLDFGGVIDELGPIDMIDAVKVSKGTGNGDAPVKTCPKCNAVCFASVGECQDCGYEFPPNEIDLARKASTAAALSTQIEHEWHDVLGVSYKEHAKPNKTTSMCVTYDTLSGQYREWICYEHKGYAREKAIKWHSRRTDAPVPYKVQDALVIPLKQPSRIRTIKEGKYYRITAYDFAEKQAEEQVIEEFDEIPMW